MKKRRANVTNGMKKKSRPPKLKVATFAHDYPEDEGHCVGELNIDDMTVTLHPPPQAGPNVIGIKIPVRRRQNPRR